ncbi:DUF2892 domain-containing protein [Roseospira marina]|uniref:DUF2892 domain-containing protein n=1 Tax=Roseospira marina TaxID=140057 RepID=A0A5M6IBE7_9PROT|nr:DUF2892 domain-containing protein [Roseospira marina]KAA5605624.1 DUF2892 domain-containing protein [Roseospira marina]MBB4313305.1 hypothetical protein [Roseospira marina]MBB5085954.1 hypothetical protein [Roseospira marina]
MFDFERNVGFYDSIARIVIGMVLIAGAVFGGPSMIVGWVGVVPLATGLMGKCPMYKFMGFDTIKYS